MSWRALAAAGDGPQDRRWSLPLLVGAIAASTMAACNALASPPAPATAPSHDPHQFVLPHHAPFLALAEYKPIYDRHGPGYIVIDVREPAARARADIPADIWVPVSDAAGKGWRYVQQYRDKILVLYCGCPWAEAATESVILESHGFSDIHLRVLHQCIPGWMAAGFPVIRGADPCRESPSWDVACRKAA